jgi:Xaa-Pro aminopeptidase
MANNHSDITAEAPAHGRAYNQPALYALPFPPQEYEQRLERIRSGMEAEEIEVALVTDPKSVLWLVAGKAKFEFADNPICVIVPRAGEGPVTVVVRLLEADVFQRSSAHIVERFVEYPDGGPIIPYDPLFATVEALKEMYDTPKRVGVAERYFGRGDGRRFEALLPEFSLHDFPVERIRFINSPLEIHYMTIAAEANAWALQQAMNQMYVGMNEWQFMMIVHQLHREYLADHYDRSSESAQTAQFGQHTFDMHITRRKAEMEMRVSKEGDLGWLEPGVFVHGYVGCMIRSAYFGANPPQFLIDGINAAASGLESGLKIMGPGVQACDVDSAIRRELEKTGLPVLSRTGYGCGIGWDVGNAGSIAPDNPIALRAGETYHLIAHMRGPMGFFGLSEQATITDDGCRVLVGEEIKPPHDLRLVRR